MFAKLLLLLVLVPLADLILLLMISRVIGFWGAVALVITTGMAGVLLFRWQLRMLARAAQRQAVPTAETGNVLSDGLMIFVGAALLVTPGLITDTIGLSLLIPATRRWHQRKLFQWLLGKSGVTLFYSTFSDKDATVVDGQVVDRNTERSDSC